MGKYLEVVKNYVDQVLESQRDIYRGTPLLADAIDVETGELFKWRNEDDTFYVVSNLAVQQNFMGILRGLTGLTGESKYEDKAKEITKYMLENYRAENHLLYWGGHAFIDLQTGEAVGPANKTMPHELKGGYPNYDLLFKVDENKAKEFIEAFWNAHMYDWGELEVGRHGEYSGEAKPYPFNHEFVYKEPHRASKGLSFLNAGSDLIYAAAKYFEHSQDKKALAWAEFLMKQYVDARNPETGLGAYQFTQPMKQIDPTTHHIPDQDTNSKYGDRAVRQFGEDYPNALETKMLIAGRAQTTYTTNVLMQIQLYKEIGEAAKQFKKWALEASLAFVKYMYNEKDCTIRQMMTDGTDLTGYILKKDGYYGPRGRILEPLPLTSTYLLTLARLYGVCKEEQEVHEEDKKYIWQAIVSMARGLGIGELGDEPSASTILNLDTENADAITVLVLLELYQITGQESYKTMACKVGDNILERHYYKGYFLEEKDYIYNHLDRLEPLVLLTLEAVLQGKANCVPSFINGAAYIDGAYKFADGTFRPTRSFELYRQKRN